MTENEKLEALNQEAEEIKACQSNEDTTPTETKEVTIPIKFNKEIKNLTVSEAGTLAQKGMKYDLICGEYETLKNLSRKNGKSVTEFLEDLKLDGYNKRMQELTEKCGGDQAFAEHIINLEDNYSSEDIKGFSELQQYFPNFKSAEELPEEITEAAKLRGTKLLDEYLRYCLKEKKRLEEIQEELRLSKNASLGSQLNRKSRVSPEALEFLKGLWK